MRESSFQRDLILELRDLFPGCLVLKNDSSYIQGIPDLLVLYKDNWAALECKASITSRHRPNQDYYIDKMDRMSFASYISPETKGEVLGDLQSAFGITRKTRVPKR